MKHPKQIVWYGPPYSYSGYALHNRAMILELLKLGWDIRLMPTEEHIPEQLIGKEVLLSLVKNVRIDPKNSISLNLIPPPSLPLYGKYTILFTTLESKTVHEGFFNRCKLFDEVWVPCLENVKSLKKAGIPKGRLFYCPEGVNTDFWTPFGKKSERYISNDFTFFYNGDWSYRKGIDILIRAYAKAFLPTDPVRLLMLVHYQGNGKEKSQLVIPEELRYICRQYQISKLPKIEFIFDMISDPELPELYRCSDCYVCPTRGEAWGLPIIQAMSCGIPAIVPEWGGQTDYCNKSNSYLIKTEKFDTMDDKVNLMVDFYKYQKFCFPDVKHLTKLMYIAYQQNAYTKLLGKVARESVVKNFQWKESGKIADRRLTQIHERLDGR